MSDSNQMQDDWNEMVEQMNDAVADSVEQNMQAQAALIDAWSDAFDNSVPEEDVVEDGIEGYNRAYEVWMDAAEEMFEKTTDAAEGEDIGPTEFRDIWLQSANDAFKEVMSTSAFASANGQLVETMMEMQQEVDEVTQDTVSQMGLPTRDDVEEVGDRLIELERRQHDVEQKLDRILDALEE
ncbi:MAG: poly(R)-hydroxyalkanoic acid synthase subunit PhaE [Haloarculaceae archaeon]